MQAGTGDGRRKFLRLEKSLVKLAKPCDLGDVGSSHNKGLKLESSSAVLQGAGA